MFRRYKTAKVKVDPKTQNRYYSPILYPNIPEKDTDIIHNIRSGDRLDLLAHQYYGDVNLWWIISRANRLDPSDLGLDVGTTLRIPVEVGEILGKLQEENR
jgi:nucleoid-associated protein YgaU|tara:strand:- start:1374 stop:1676 length:303 start_codon:yes stop_codon:yes gene_type:complete